MTDLAKSIRFKKEKAIEGARLAAQLRGCICQPSIEIRELRPQVFIADLAHDHFCPVVGGTGKAS